MTNKAMQRRASKIASPSSSESQRGAYAPSEFHLIPDHIRKHGGFMIKPESLTLEEFKIAVWEQQTELLSMAAKELEDDRRMNK